MPVNYILGMNAKLYAGVGDLALASLTEITNVKDLTLNLSAAEADVSTRANSGWRATASTLKEATCEFQMQWKPGDDGFEIFETAFIAGNVVSLAALTGAIATADSEGLYGDWSVTNFSRSEPLEEAIVVDVSCKLALFKKWIEEGVE